MVIKRRRPFINDVDILFPRKLTFQKLIFKPKRRSFKSLLVTWRKKRIKSLLATRKKSRLSLAVHARAKANIKFKGPILPRQPIIKRLGRMKTTKQVPIKSQATAFIRGRFFVKRPSRRWKRRARIINNRAYAVRRRGRKKLISQIPKIRKRIRRVIRLSYCIPRLRKYRGKRKLKHMKKKKRRMWKATLKESYFRRYFVKRKKKNKKRLIYDLTFNFDANQIPNFEEENTMLLKLRSNLIRNESNKMLNTPWGTQQRSSIRPLSERSFSFGRVYLTHRRRNTFISINKIKEDPFLGPEELIIFKSSCGLLRYKGPKRRTLHARMAVAKDASAFLAYHEFSTIDIIFTSGIGRMFTRMVRSLNEKQINVRYMIIPKRRSHGFTRKKKKKRL